MQFLALLTQAWEKFITPYLSGFGDAGSLTVGQFLVRQLDLPCDSLHLERDQCRHFLLNFFELFEIMVPAPRAVSSGLRYTVRATATNSRD